MPVGMPRGRYVWGEKRQVVPGGRRVYARPPARAGRVVGPGMKHAAIGSEPLPFRRGMAAGLAGRGTAAGGYARGAYRPSAAAGLGGLGWETLRPGGGYARNPATLRAKGLQPSQESQRNVITRLVALMKRMNLRRRALGRGKLTWGNLTQNQRELLLDAAGARD